jgi:hypothetical protein
VIGSIPLAYARNIFSVGTRPAERGCAEGVEGRWGGGGALHMTGSDRAQNWSQMLNIFRI